jgi:hypothetical protein
METDRIPWGQYELYKVDQDIPEEHDLADLHQEKVRELAGMLEKWLKRTGVPISIDE